MTSPFSAAAFRKVSKSTTTATPTTVATTQAPAPVPVPVSALVSAPVSAPRGSSSETTCRLCGQEAAGHCPGLDAGKHHPCSPRMLQMVGHLPVGPDRLKAREVINSLGKGRCFGTDEANLALDNAGLGKGSSGVDPELELLEAQAREAELALAADLAAEEAVAAANRRAATVEAAKVAAAERIAAATATLAARKAARE